MHRLNDSPPCGFGVSTTLPQHRRPTAPSETAWEDLLLALERTQKHLERQFTEVAEFLGLTWAEALALVAAESLGGLCQQRELGDRLGCSPGHVSGVVERLRARGLLAAERLPRDRRRQCWRITDAGRNCLSALWQAWGTRYVACDDLPTERLADLADRLEALRAHAQRTTEVSQTPGAAAPGGAAA